jgi:hypothetical protein
MNSLLTKKAMKINGLFNQSTVNHTLFAAILLSVSSTQAFANRPAVEEASETVVIEEPADSSATEAATPESPSAVEVMMQQETTQPRTQQTGTIVQLPAKEMQPGETIKIKLLDYPRRGMSMDKVKNEYGQPIAASDSVGQPPITSWTYSDRVVYFEYSTVLHVVAR